MKKLIAISLFIIINCFNAKSQENISQIDRIPTTSNNTNYASNRPPLLTQQFIKLPAGSIKPSGWLLTQLESQKNGLHGHLEEISAWLQKDDNAWLSAGGKWGWEEVPYWLRGYSDLAYILEDKDMQAKASVWINGIINSQRTDGSFGPDVKNKDGSPNLWPNMLALNVLQTYYEYSGNNQIIDFMTKYFHYQLNIPDEQFLKGFWEKSRCGDNLWSVLWLYNRTGDSELLNLAEKIHRCSADWTLSTQLPNWHNVNIVQGMKEPAIYYLINKDEKFLKASYNVQSFIRRAFGQVPGGMFGGDEHCRIGFFDPHQGIETCGMAEQMATDEIMLLISGDTYWAENLEDIAFNSFPAAFMPDYRGLRYITSPNMVVSDSKNHNPGIENEGAFLNMNPFSSRCCQHNHGFAWTYYNDHLILATPDNGAAAILFNSCEAQIEVADKKKITIKETSDYPFDTIVNFEIQTKKNVSFPFYLRIPTWCKNASLSINEKIYEGKLSPGKYLCIKRLWKNGDKIQLNLPMEISMRQWQVNKNSVSVDYGPLTLSLKIGEHYEKIIGNDAATFDSKWQKDADVSQWPTYEIYPTTPWNYALQTSTPIILSERKKVINGVNPFTVENSPLTFKAKGQKIPSWTIDEYGLCEILPYENVPKTGITEEIELIPMGAARLRISAFPTCE